MCECVCALGRVGGDERQCPVPGQSPPAAEPTWSVGRRTAVEGSNTKTSEIQQEVSSHNLAGAGWNEG